MHTLAAENSDSIDGKCSLAARSTQHLLPEIWAEHGSAPTSHLALHALLVEDQRHVLQQFVCPSCCNPLPLVSFPENRACSLACRTCVAPSVFHVRHVLSLCNAGRLACCISSCSFQIDCYQPTSCCVLHSMTVCNTEQTQTETCVVGTTHFAKLRCSVGSVLGTVVAPSAHQPNQRPA